MIETQGDLFTAAAERRDAGIERAGRHADEERPGWRDGALTFLRAFARGHYQFLAEDVVAAAHGPLPKPPDGRAWGGVLRAAARAGIIEKAGYAPARSSNLSPKVLWRSRLFDLGEIR